MLANYTGLGSRRDDKLQGRVYVGGRQCLEQIVEGCRMCRLRSQACPVPDTGDVIQENNMCFSKRPWPVLFTVDNTQNLQSVVFNSVCQQIGCFIHDPFPCFLYSSRPSQLGLGQQ